MMPPIADAALSHNGVEEVYAGVDWVSCSLAREAPNFWAWVNGNRLIIEEIAKEGHKLEARTLNGYMGMVAGGSFYGTRDDGAYVQLSSYRADSFLERVYRADVHISRLDVQVTVRFKQARPELGQYYRQKALDANAALPNGRQRRIWNMEGNDGGYTLYIGSPSSEQRARIYNKAVQSEDTAYVRCWRFEVVFRNQLASAWAERIAHFGILRADLCAQIVETWLLGRGIKPPWFYKSAPVTLPLFNEIPSDAEKKLTWLKDQVRPALRWLVQNGYEEQAMDALGMVAPIEEEWVWQDKTLWRFSDG
jgi:hypothetical protein